MGITTGILLFDDVEELDFVGPWEVLTSAAMLEQRGPRRHDRGARGRCAARRACACSPTTRFADAPPLDVRARAGRAGHAPRGREPGA